MNFSDEILKTMQIMINRKLKNYRVDRTYKSVVKRITPKGYVVLDDAGGERTVQCCIPNVVLQVGQKVYIKEPLGKLNELHICGLAD